MGITRTHKGPWFLCAVIVVALTGGCGDPIRPSSATVTLELLGTGSARVGDWTVFPPGGEPVVVAAASNTAGVRSLRLAGEVTIGCKDGPTQPTRLVRQKVDIAEPEAASGTGTQTSFNAIRQLSLNEDQTRRSCRQSTGTYPLPSIPTGAIVAELTATAVFGDSDDPVTSTTLRLRSRVLAVANLNIIGADQTAVADGFGTFDERLDRLAAALAEFDLVSLQEVGDADQVSRLAEKAGFPQQAAYPDLGFLSRWPLTDIRELLGDKPGCVLYINCPFDAHIHAATVIVGGQPIRIINAHVSGDGGPGADRSAYRAAQAQQIREKLIEPFSGIVIVAGDFNGNDDLVAPKGPLNDAFNTTNRATVKNPDDGTDIWHCGDRIELILTSPQVASVQYNGIFGRCPQPLNLSDHPRVSALLAL
jgi:endonuclease/exonuclease/phosphatase family metal-dependent hydrolase